MKCPHCGKETDEPPSLFETPVASDAGPDRRAKGNGAARSTKHRLPAGWAPTEPEKLYCQQQGKDPDAFAVAFQQFHQIKGTKFERWDLAWMKACREWASPKTPATLPTPTLYDEPWPQRIAAWKATGFWMPGNYGPKPGDANCRVPKHLLELTPPSPDAHRGTRADRENA